MADAGPSLSDRLVVTAGIDRGTSSAGIQGVRKLMSSFGENNMKTANAMFMVYLQMCPPLSLIPALMQSGIPLIKLSSVPATMHDHAARSFFVSVSSDVGEWGAHKLISFRLVCPHPSPTYPPNPLPMDFPLLDFEG